jgi:hypothetical protein
MYHIHKILIHTYKSIEINKHKFINTYIYITKALTNFFWGDIESREPGSDHFGSEDFMLEIMLSHRGHSTWRNMYGNTSS